MYAILNLSAGWGSSGANINTLARAIISLVTGASLTSVRDNAFAGYPLFNFAKSSRVASRAEDFWIKDTDYTAHSLCDTLTPKTKYVKLENASSHLNIWLGVDSAFNVAAGSQAYNYSSPLITNGASLNVHVYCTERCIVLGFVQENAKLPGCVSILSEITYESMPYIDDSSNAVIPAVLSTTLCYNPKLSGSGGETQNPFYVPTYMSNYDSGALAGIASLPIWRIGNATVTSNPVTSIIGDVRIGEINQEETEALLPFGVSTAIGNATIFSGSITDKTGIYFMNGMGYPEDSYPKSVSPDVLLHVDGIDYVVLDKFLIPYA